MDTDDLEHKFTYHPPTGDQPETYGEIRERALYLALFLNANCPQSRELSLAIKRIEEAVFWANASIARSRDTEVYGG